MTKDDGYELYGGFLADRLRDGETRLQRLEDRRETLGKLWMDLEMRLLKSEETIDNLLQFIKYRGSFLGTFEGYLTDPEHEKKEKLK